MNAKEQQRNEKENSIWKDRVDQNLHIDLK